MTGRKPRPVTARSVALLVVVSAPLSLTSQIAWVRTPPAVNHRPPPTVFGDFESLIVIDEKSMSARLYP